MSEGPDALFDGDTVAVWAREPNLVFTQVRTSHYTVAHAETFVGPIMSRVRATLSGKRFVWISDSRRIQTYEPGSRLLLTRWGIDHRQELERIVMLVSPQHRYTRMGIQVAAMAVGLVGLPMHVETSLDQLLARHGITWPGGL